MEPENFDFQRSVGHFYPSVLLNTSGQIMVALHLEELPLNSFSAPTGPKYYINPFSSETL